MKLDSPILQADCQEVGRLAGEVQGGHSRGGAEVPGRPAWIAQRPQSNVARPVGPEASLQRIAHSYEVSACLDAHQEVLAILEIIVDSKCHSCISMLHISSLCLPSTL